MYVIELIQLFELFRNSLLNIETRYMEPICTRHMLPRLRSYSHNVSYANVALSTPICTVVLIDVDGNKVVTSWAGRSPCAAK